MEARIRDSLSKVLTPSRLLVIFTIINLLNYLDRGIVPGAFDQIGDFVTDQLHTNHTDVYIGSLQSSFIAGYAIASITFGHLVHFYPPFKLMTVGLGIWCGAVILSGVAPKFWVLVIGRILSGVGEASFQTVVPPYIDDTAPPHKRGLWLAFFFSAIPCGTAMGYGYGAVVATAASWRLAFLLEAPLMAPFAVLCWFLKHNRHPPPEDLRKSLTEGDDSISPLLEGKAPDPISGPRADIEDDVLLLDKHPGQPAQPSMWDELKVIFSRPVYVTTVLGYAAYTWVTAGFAAFGPIFLKGLGLFDKETTASLSFGAVVAVTGFVGTAVGGVVMDKLQSRDWKKQEAKKAQRNLSLADGSVNAPPAHRRRVVPPKEPSSSDDGLRRGSLELEAPGAASAPHDRDSTGPPTEDSEEVLDSKLCACTPFSFWCMVAGFALCLLLPMASKSLATFFPLLAVGVTFLFGTTAAVNIVIMASVPPQTRSFAIGVSTVIVHACGDVPSPTVIGAVADKLSPKSDGHRSASGLRETLFLLVLWLAWGVLFWGLAWLFALRRRSQRESREAKRMVVS